MTRRRLYSDEQLITEYYNSTSIADLCRRLGLKSGCGGSHPIVQKHCIRLGLDPGLLKNQAWNKGKTFEYTPRILDEDVFCNPTKYKSPSKVKARALRLGYISENCEICGQKPIWNQLHLTMILDHIDGNPSNNLPSNLRTVCPNCDIQLPTSRGRNKKRLPSC